MTTASDILVRQRELETDRAGWTTIWEDIARFCLPDVPDMRSFGMGHDRIVDGPKSVARGRTRHDDTALRAVDRLASGMESLTTPQSQKWHGLASSDPLSPEPTDEEKEYFERFRDYLFATRYNARAGFVGAHQKALRSCIAFGTGVVFVEEAMGPNERNVPVLYRYLPLSECFLAVDAQGNPDTMYRRFTMTARQAVQKFGDKCHKSIQEAADHITERDRRFKFLHAVEPRSERGGGRTNRQAPWASFYVDEENSHLISESGFFEFPFVVYYWQPVEDLPYAQSPVMLALADIKGLNAIRKTTMRGLQQFFDPPIAITHDGVMNRPNMNPGAINYAAIDANGRPRIQPIHTMARPDFAQEIITAERQVVNDSMYVNLFQILMQSPDMTATEAMIRANEKGELLGPAGGKIQHAMAQMVEREAAIIIRKGAADRGAALEPPDTMKGRPFSPTFTSPLDRLRKAQEGLGIQRTLQSVLPLAQIDPSVVDNFDLDEISRLTAEIEGAPHRILKTQDERDESRASRQQMQQMQAGLEMAKTGGEAAKNIVPAMAEAQAMSDGAPQQ